MKPSDAIRANVRGEKRLLDRLERLKLATQKRILRPAVTAAARPIRQAAKANVPVQLGLLKRSLIVKTITYPQTAVAIVGPQTKLNATRVNLFGRTVLTRPTKYAHLVEGGTRPHLIRLGRGGKVQWMHPGTPPRRFLQRAAENQMATAQAKLNQKIREGLEKYA